jgi:hypothetical protein
LHFDQLGQELGDRERRGPDRRFVDEFTNEQLLASSTSGCRSVKTVRR